MTIEPSAWNEITLRIRNARDCLIEPTSNEDHEDALTYLSEALELLLEELGDDDTAQGREAKRLAIVCAGIGDSI
jgi:hypothetical protein